MSSEHEAVPGLLLGGRYAVQREAGRGGMATVYVARDTTTGECVAVKVLRPDVASTVSTERFLREIHFQREIEHASHSRHPNVLPVLDTGVDHGLPYYVMPYVEGESLRARLQRERQLPVDEALRVAAEVGAALSHAHERRILHRDVSPGNVLLSGPRVFVADFGIARAMVEADGDRMTDTGIVIGTPAYMSPEQGAGDRQLDARSDQYALGAVLFEMLAGQPPFTGPSPQAVVARKMVARAPDVRELRPTVPEHVARAIGRALEGVSADRFHTVAQFIDALTAQSPAASTLHSRPTPSWSRSTRRRTLAVAGLAAGAAAVFATVTLGSPSTGTLVARGQTALATGDVAGAQRALREAAERTAARTPDGASARLWLAQALFLADDSTAEWRSAARAASLGRDSLAPGDAARAQALAALADNRYGAACPALRSLAQGVPDDLVLTITIADCMARDSAVVRDPSSRSGWRFRTSYTEARRLYQRVLDERPAGDGLRRIVFPRVSRLFLLEWGRTRRGFARDDRSLRFGAFPSLVRDSLADTIELVPFRLPDIAVGRPGMEVPNGEEAIAHDRGALRAIALAWTREMPRSADAHARLAQVLESTGELAPARPGAPSAIAAVRVARRFATRAHRPLRLVQDEVRLLVKLGDFEGARALVDSVLGRHVVADHAESADLAPLAALTGRAHRTAALLRARADDYAVVLPDAREYRVPPPLAATVLSLSGYAALGAPSESLRVLTQRADRQLRSYTAPSQRDSVRTAVLAQALPLALPTLGPDIVRDMIAGANPTLRMQQSLARGDTRAVRADLDALRALRHAHPSATTSIDVAFIEAWLRVAIGDTAQAVEQLDEVLGALPALGTSLLREVPMAAALARVMRLRIVLASRAGDTATAGRWAAAADALHRNADPHLQQ